ncbi:hypothetical protein DFA_03647 [Cavenderia fasciculata]|uniref:Mitochondrial genome maintenance protein n=1 Tax=Cavenderia fasciculata TaxID=261658 RepID=F4PIG9_CACFS|nr:uncharacterized protein DFA_03647 [Cavenderia fasciculata]EGG25398.1 hypothetical protein DFA_03647 [Cavenderia fasciculata]|eukprot:XP_004363249.1 hypothetical protein DFA_03647 [Cavenderia fasciculata]
MLNRLFVRNIGFRVTTLTAASSHSNKTFQPTYSYSTSSSPQQQSTTTTNYASHQQPSSQQSANKQQQALLNERFYDEEKFKDISKEPFAREITDVLLGELDNNDIEIKPDGIIYLPEIKYRRILNQAFGPGGWALKPFGGPVVISGSLIRPYALFCLGRYVSESFGEQPYVEGGHLSFATANEAAKSNALVRCCKDLGIGSSLWDPTFIRNWKAANAAEKFYVNVKSGEKRKFWSLKNGNSPINYPWKESSSSSYNDGQQQQQTQPIQQPQFDSSVSFDEVIPSISQPKQPQQSFQSSSSSVDHSEELDIDSPVPPQLKKYAGKTWREVIQDPKGIDYIKWVANTLTGKVKLQTQAIINFLNEQQNQQQ